MTEDSSTPHNYQNGFTPVKGTELYYEILGSGYPLVLIHAGLVNHSMWDEQFDLFFQQYRVLGYDARSYGRSKSPPGNFLTSRICMIYERFRELARQPS